VGFGGLRVLGLLFPLVVLAACAPTDGPPRVQRADVAVSSYAPPSGAPDFCAALAATTHVTGLPVVVGTLTALPDDVGSKTEITGAVDELQGVLEQVRNRPGTDVLAGSLAELIAALRSARDSRLTDEVRAEISAGLDDVGRDAQAACGFPS